MGIATRHLNRFVPHQLLNPPQINSLHGQTRSKRVPEIVPSKILDSSLSYRLIEPMARAHQRLTLHAQEQAIASAFRRSGLRNSNIATATELSGTYRFSPCFDRRMVRIQRAKSTSDHAAEYCSLHLIPVLSATSNSGRCQPCSVGADYTLVRLTNKYWLMVTLYRDHWLSRRVLRLFAFLTG
jgi:hypothetical protein